MAKKQSTLTGETTPFDIEVFKSRRSFTNLFDKAVRLDCITYCESPEIILELFDEFGLDTLEVIVGDVEDYRERLIDKPDTADRLEQLKQEESLRIFTCPTKTIHSKLYEIEHEDGDLTLLCGSPNLTETGWRNQTNAGVVFETEPDSEVHQEFRSVYEEHKDSYADLFLEDLTEEIEASEQDREAVIERWVEGRTAQKDEIEEIHGTLTDKLVTEADPNEDSTDVVADGAAVNEDAADNPQELNTNQTDPEDSESPEQELVVSLKGFTDKAKDRVEDSFGDFATVAGDELRITPSGYGRQLNQVYGVPKMHVDVDERRLSLSAGQDYRLIGDRPPDDPNAIGQALSHLEAYFETVDDFARTNRSTAMKTHMFEALLYLFWSPFANVHAYHLRQNNLQLDKRLPFLYIYGESNSGKGTFTKFALNLLSDGQVTGALDADDFGKRRVRAIRKLDTSFPLIIDDIQKSKIRQTDTLRNYWSDWNADRTYPALVFISNDTKPEKWFRNRAKLINFDGQFASNIKGEAEVNRLIEQDNPIYHWFVDLYLDRTRELQDDVLADARSVFLELYERAERDVPAYFPDQPAEEIYDTGRRRWQQAFTDGKYSMTEEKERLHIEFSDEMEGYEIHQFKRDLPQRVRADKYGHELVIKTPEQFRDWLESGEFQATTEGGGPFSRLTRLFR